MLELTDIHKTYANGVKALNGVSLKLENGMFGLLGPNGAGKSSLMRTVAALQSPDSGEIRFNGVDVLKDPNAMRRQLGYLPQDFNVYPHMSALSLLDHIAVLKGILNDGERRDQVEALLHQTNLYDARKKAVASYSGGMRQRFGIAQALLGDPRIIIVDEPTAGLDPEERNRFHNLLCDIGENVVILLSTHIVEDVRDLCPRMAVMVGGQKILEGKPEQLIEQIEGQIWSKYVTPDSVDNYREAFNVIAVRRYLGKTKIHVLADDSPDTGFTKLTPDLEDVYFSSLVKNTSDLTGGTA